MTTDAPQISLRPCRFEDLPVLEQWQPTGRNRTHAWRFAHQEEGRSTYLLAVRDASSDDDAPAAGAADPRALDPSTLVGSCEVRWGGPDQPHVPAAPEINGLQVWPEDLRGRGLGTAILAAVEQVARDRGHRVIGLGVADPRPQRLYERLGYRPSGLRYVGRYTEHADDGSTREVSEHCLWMIKEI